MGAVTTLRKAVDVALTEARDRALGVLDAVESAAVALIDTVAEAANEALAQVVCIAFDLVGTLVAEAFNVAGAAADAALGRAPSDGPNSSDDDPAFGDFDHDAKEAD